MLALKTIRNEPNHHVHNEVNYSVETDSIDEDVIRDNMTNVENDENYDKNHRTHSNQHQNHNHGHDKAHRRRSTTNKLESSSANYNSIDADNVLNQFFVVRF